MTFPAAVRQAVEGALSERFGMPVRVAEVQNLWPSQVFRCTLQSSSREAPETVIVRIPREGTKARSGPEGLGCEQAALEYLGTVGSTLAPRFLVGGANAGFLVSEDLGTGPSLLDLLLGEDAEAATAGALAFARCLGTLHAQTAGRITGLPRLVPAALPIAEHWQQVQGAVALLGLPVPHGIDREIAEIGHVLVASGDCLALSSGDPSVVNCKVINGNVSFFDFEAACFRHPFMDASVLRFLYPTGGPAWQMPTELSPQIERAYRSELARAYPALSDDAYYERGMAAASAAWMILRLARLPRVDAGPDRDPWLLLPPDWKEPAPTRSRRRQLLSILETCIASANRAQTLPELSAWCTRLAVALRARWPEATEELPLYPAFRGTTVQYREANRNRYLDTE